MGNPASPSLASLVMDTLLRKCIPELPFDLPFLFIYVDDIITAVPTGLSHVILEKFNSFSDKIQFTIELENNNNIPFLDMLVHRQPYDNKIILDWYKKPIASDRFLNFNSQHSVCQKISILNSLKMRTLRLSDPSFHQKNLEIVRKIAIKNDYPPALINKVLSRQTTTQPKSQKPELRYHKVVNVLSINHQLKKLFEPFNIQLAFSHNKTLSQLYNNLKDPTPTTSTSNTVYRINCKNCNTKYIGQSKQKLCKRIQQHENDCRPYNLTKQNKTALAIHAHDTGHFFDFKNVTVLDREPHLGKRLFSEMIHITREPNTCNLRKDVDGLNRIYIGLLKGG